MGRVDGPSTRLVETRTRQLGPLTRAVNSGSGNRALMSCFLSGFRQRARPDSAEPLLLRAASEITGQDFV